MRKKLPTLDKLAIASFVVGTTLGIDSIFRTEFRDYEIGAALTLGAYYLGRLGYVVYGDLNKRK